MPDARTVSDTIRCDGCGREASPAHLRERIARLQWASRFRPIHVSTLFLAPAPPAALEDFFYFPESLPGDAAARGLLEDLLESTGAVEQAESDQAALVRFQHAGFYFAEAVECPVSAADGFAGVLEPLMPTLVRRIRHSYRPQSVLLLSDELSPLAAELARANLGARLLLLDGDPVPLPQAGDTQGRARFRNQIQALLTLAKPAGA